VGDPRSSVPGGRRSAARSESSPDAGSAQVIATMPQRHRGRW
jgi:hypothetical protein